jgi:hypothetical protein
MSQIDLPASIDQRLEELFQLDLVTIVGSGWSAGRGLPTMPSLAQTLITKLPLESRFINLPQNEKTTWRAVSNELQKGTDLERALDPVQEGSGLLSIVRSVIGDEVLEGESKAILSLFDERASSDLARFITYQARVDASLAIVTTNYDRLIEYSARLSGFNVDSMFPGSYVSPFDPEASRAEQAVWGTSKGHKSVTQRRHVRIFKPHGSLDWFVNGAGEVIRTEFPVALERKIVTPGQSKLAAGYEPLFDTHRSGANKAIEHASGFLAVGFGFNDSHLQTYLKAKLTKGSPALILTRDLTAAAADLIANHPKVWAISRGPDTDSSLITTQSQVIPVPNSSIWSLSEFMTQMLNVN